MIRELLTRMRFLVFRKKRSEFDEELRFHLEHSIAAKVAEGLPVAEARRQALIEFGGVEAAREDCERQRPGWWLATVAQDIRYAVRGILAHRWFSAAIMTMLALGIGLNTMVFTLVNAVLYKPVPVPRGDRLVSVADRLPSQGDSSTPFSYPDFQDYRTQAASFESFEAIDDERDILSESGNSPPSISRGTRNRRSFRDAAYQGSVGAGVFADRRSCWRRIGTRAQLRRVAGTVCRSCQRDWPTRARKRADGDDCRGDAQGFPLSQRRGSLDAPGSDNRPGQAR
jgi:hypothetical protein